MASEAWPVIVLDTETTGIDVEKDRIVEISIQAGAAKDAACWTQRINPGIPIPAGATETHGITDADVAKCPPFRDFAGEIGRRLTEAKVIVGYNIRRFDIPLLLAELQRAGAKPVDLNGKHLIDVLCLWQNCEPRTLESAHRRFVGTELEGAHGAEADTRATGRVLKGMMKAFGLENSYEALARKSGSNFIGFSNHFQWQEGVAVFGFGKYRGQPLHVVAGENPGYFDFILSKDFPKHVHEISGELIRRSGRSFVLEEFHAWLVEGYGGPPNNE